MSGDPVDIARRLMAMQKSLAASLDWIDNVAAVSTAAGAHGLAFASHMLSEALAVWKTEMTLYMTTYLKEAADAEGSDG